MPVLVIECTWVLAMKCYGRKVRCGKSCETLVFFAKCETINIVTTKVGVQFTKRLIKIQIAVSGMPKTLRLDKEIAFSSGALKTSIHKLGYNQFLPDRMHMQQPIRWNRQKNLEKIAPTNREDEKNTVESLQLVTKTMLIKTMRVSLDTILEESPLLRHFLTSWLVFSKLTRHRAIIEIFYRPFIYVFNSFFVHPNSLKPSKTEWSVDVYYSILYSQN